MNSLRAVFRSLEYEIQRQIEVLESGGTVAQETRGWIEDRGVTVSQRSKEFANDYRYLPEPDLPPLLISRDWVDEVRESLPELPDERHERLQRDYGLSPYDAALLTASRRTADYFEKAVAAKPLEGDALQARAKAVANLINSELARLLNLTGIELWESKVAASALSELADLVDDRTVSSTQAKQVLEEMFESGASPKAVVEAKGLSQVTDEGAILTAVQEALDNNPQAVEDYLGGKDNAVKFLVGQVMKATRGRAAPATVNQLLEEQLAARKG
jgi:aspartyl-tRNA(Asn)/glutamyl-tRNA(Gln) amidotransferase subunit B